MYCEDMSVFVFIDASNVWELQKAKGKLLDYKKLKFFLKKYFLASELKIFYYTAYPKEGSRPYSTKPIHDFYTFLIKDVGFILRKKELKRIVIHDSKTNEYSILEKGNMDVEITIDVIDCIRNFEKMIIFTGDSDFLALIKYVKNRGKDVFVFSSKNNISQELRGAAHRYFDVLDLDVDIWRRPLTHRKTPL